MTFLMPCPNCGPRPVEEFGCNGEIRVRPKSKPTRRELSDYVYMRDNVAGPHREWWHHRHGCETWFVVERDTRTHEVLAVHARGAR